MNYLWYKNNWTTVFCCSCERSCRFSNVKSEEQLCNDWKQMNKFLLGWIDAAEIKHLVWVISETTACRLRPTNHRYSFQLSFWLVLHSTPPAMLNKIEITLKNRHVFAKRTFLTFASICYNVVLLTANGEKKTLKKWKWISGSFSLMKNLSLALGKCCI